MQRSRYAILSGLLTWAILGYLSVSTAWGYFFDDRREMSLSGFAYSRGTVALANDRIGTHKGYYQIGNLVSHRNFVTLEWRHNINRVTRSTPTVRLLP
jgi:hypothetical protein